MRTGSLRGSCGLYVLHILDPEGHWAKHGGPSICSDTCRSLAQAGNVYPGLQGAGTLRRRSKLSAVQIREEGRITAIVHHAQQHQARDQGQG